MPKPCQTRNSLIINNGIKQSVHFWTLMVSGNGQSNHFWLWFSYHIVSTHNSAPKLQLLQLWPRKSFCSYSQTTSEWSVTEVVPTSDRYSTYNYWHKKYCSSEDECHDLALISIRPKFCENIKKAKVSILMSGSDSQYFIRLSSIAWATCFWSSFTWRPYRSNRK